MKNTKNPEAEHENILESREEENQFYQNTPSTIRIIRESNGLSQKYVADKLEITQQQYSNIEKHPDNASLKRFKELSNIFKVPVTTLIGETENYIQQNFQQQGGQAATILNNTGLPDKERELYERMILELKEQISMLKMMVSHKNEL
jgi:transcriptional regulator with XRE-family HTH domain